MALKKESKEIGTPTAKAWGFECCPVCGGRDHCVAIRPGTVWSVWSGARKEKVDVAIDRAVLCMRAPQVGVDGVVNGMRALGVKGGPNGGRYFIEDAGGRALTQAEIDAAAADRRERERRAALETQRMVELCRGLWERAERNPAAAAYFAARGVPIAHLQDGDLPASLRWTPSLEYKHQDRDLQPGPAVIAAVVNGAGEVRAVHRIYLDVAGEPKKRSSADCGAAGDVEGGAAKMALGPISGCHVDLGGEPGARTLVLCEGIETGLMIAAANVPAVGWRVWACISGGGLGSVEIPAAMVGGDAGITRIIVAGDLDSWKVKRGDRPGHTYANKAADRLRGLFPACQVDVAIPRHVDCPELVDEAGAPKSDAGCDWLDVGRGSLAAVATGLVMSSGNAEVPPPAAWEKGEALTAAQPAAPAEPKEDGYWHDDGFYVAIEGGKEKPLMPKGDQPRADIMLRDRFNPARLSDGVVPEASRFTIAYWEQADQWLRWTGTRYEPVTADSLRGEVLKYYLRWYTKDKKDNISLAGLSCHQAASIVEALKTRCTVRAEGLPVWVPPSFGGDGRPLFDTDRQPAKPAGVVGRTVIAFENGLADVETLRASRKLEMHPHSTLYINTTCMPFELPVAEIRAELAGDPEGEARGGPLCAELAPRWMQFMSDISKGDDDVPRALQQYFGYILAPESDQERFLYLVGKPGVGKGTILDASAAVVGVDSVAASSLNKIIGRFDLAPFLGKKLVHLDEMLAGASTDLVEATRSLLSVVGNALQSVDLKNRDVMASVRLSVKVIATGNKVQRFIDPSGAFGRRLLIVRIPKLGKPDPAFKQTIRKEARGIMVWAFFGLLDLAKSGTFVQPANGLELRRQFMRLSSKVASFAQDCLMVEEEVEEERTGHFSSRASLLYGIFTQWCEANGIPKPMSMEDFASDLAAAVESFRAETLQVGTDQFAVWHGVRPRLKIDDRPAADWDEHCREISTSTIYDDGSVVAAHAGHRYLSDDNLARFGPFGFNYKGEASGQVNAGDDWRIPPA